MLKALFQCIICLLCCATTLAFAGGLSGAHVNQITIDPLGTLYVATEG